MNSKLLALRLCLCAVAVSLRAGAAEKPDLEVVGLLDFGSLKAVCFKVQANGDSFVLHPGETAHGYTLRSVESMTGRVVVAVGAKEYELGLTSRIISAPPPVGVATFNHNGTNTNIPADLETSDPVSGAKTWWVSRAQDGPSQPIEEQGRLSKQWVWYRVGGGDKPLMSFDVPKTTVLQLGNPQSSVASPEASPSKTPPASETEQVPPPQKEPRTSAAETSPSPQKIGSVDSEQEQRLAAERVEGESIRGLYGLEAFFAWDLQRRSR